MRPAISKRLRFETFKRDGFRCLYCGASPLNSTLEVKFHVDHVQAVADGGETDPANLVTACVDCNLGKGAVPLDRRRLKSSFDSEAEREHAEQIRAYLEAQREIVAAKKDVEAEALGYWIEQCGESFVYTLPGILNGAVREFGIAKTCDAINIVGRHGGLGSATKQAKYFCGILRNWRQNGVDAPPSRRDEEDAPPSRMLTAQHVLAEYWAYRTESDACPDELVQLAVAALSGGQLAARDLYRIMDHAIGSSRQRYGDVDSRLAARVTVRLINETVRCGKVPPEVERFLLFSHRQLDRYRLHETGVKCLDHLWSTAGGHPEDIDLRYVLLDTVIDVLMDVEGTEFVFELIDTAMKGRESASWPEKVAGLRQTIAEAIHDDLATGPSPFHGSAVTKWPEFLALPSLPEG